MEFTDRDWPRKIATHLRLFQSNVSVKGNSDTSQIEREIFRGHHLSSIPLAFYHTLNQEAIDREIEKDAIRQEIIASETARKRRLLLEYEVRMELNAQLANGRDPGLLFAQPAHHSADPFQRLLVQKPYEYISGSKKEAESEPPGLIVNTKKPTTEYANSCDRGLSFTRPAPHSAEPFECLLVQKPYEYISGSKKEAESPPPGLILNTKKPTTEHANGYDRGLSFTRPAPHSSEPFELLLVQKPYENISGSKKKAESPPPGEIVSTKKDWSCEIFEINSTSEQALTEHLQGRKHKAKEAAAGRRFRAKKLRRIPTFDPRAKKEAEEKPTTENSKVRKRYFKRYRFWCDVCKMGTNTMKIFLKHKEHRHNGRTGESQFKGRDRIRYTRDLLIQLREAVAQVPEDILKLKQEVEAEFCVDPSWSRGENDARLCAAQELDINSKSDEFERKSNALLEDYFGAMLVEVVRESILSGLEKSPPCVEPVLKLLTSMYGEKVVNANDIEAGCLLHAESLEALPKAPDSFGEIVGGLVLTGIFDFKVVGEILRKVGDDFYGKSVFGGVMKVVGSGPGGKEVLGSQADDVKACESLF